MFLARISRGRTVRQFVVGIVLVPSTLSLVWFSIFGGFALYLEDIGRSVFGDGTLEPQLFNLLRELPLAPVVMVIAMALISIFFITSADSASIVMGGMAQYGAENPTRWVTMLMGTFTAAVAIIMLVAGDGGDNALESLQNMTIIAASPFRSPVVMVIAMALISIFFISSADSASIVMGGMAQYGAENPTRWVTMLMGTFTAAVAIIMLVAGDGGDNALESLQNMTIIAASPF